ncbi:hypothetical protein EVAR_91306_1 [Eumeta japonica]|uniref:Reverse transcriptase domain-containing protein n=1 Tax=Eumeta variegata TaxID=151549 RepID=A0A4C1SN92_EUMVA|nr:hypothetical protein EVAR_91306_1 [Eumeta japonica]
MIIYSLEGLFTLKELDEFLSYDDILAEAFNKKVKAVHRKKFADLYELQKRELGIKLNNKWFINKSDVDIPQDIQWTLENKEEQEIARSRLAMIIDNHIKIGRNSDRDRFVLDKVRKARHFLKENRDVVILNSDKGNLTVAMNRCDYELRMEDIVGDTAGYLLINKDPTSRLQRQNNEIVDKLFQKEIISLKDKLKLKTNEAIAPRLYGVPKIHKECYPLRPICSCVNTPSYELCKYISGILKKINNDSKYNVKDSLQFKDRIRDLNLDSDDRLISLDVVSLFPSIPVDLARQIIESKWDKIREYTDIDKDFFLSIVGFCIDDSRYFQYKKKVYIQKRGLPMGSPASPVVADIVMEELLDCCIEKLAIRPKIITKYVDDLFCVVSEGEVDNILDVFNSYHVDIKFTIEKESDCRLAYLDTLIVRKDNGLLVDWYQKPTSSEKLEKSNIFNKERYAMAYRTYKTLDSLFSKMKDKVDKLDMSNVVYRIPCGGNGAEECGERIVTRGCPVYSVVKQSMKPKPNPVTVQDETYFLPLPLITKWQNQPQISSHCSESIQLRTPGDVELSIENFTKMMNQAVEHASTTYQQPSFNRIFSADIQRLVSEKRRARSAFLKPKEPEGANGHQVEKRSCAQLIVDHAILGLTFMDGCLSNSSS